jgi:hypothetical protein
MHRREYLHLTSLPLVHLGSLTTSFCKSSRFKEASLHQVRELVGQAPGLQRGGLFIVGRSHLTLKALSCSLPQAYRPGKADKGWSAWARPTKPSRIGPGRGRNISGIFQRHILFPKLNKKYYLIFYKISKSTS